MDWTPDYVHIYEDGVLTLSCPKYADKLVPMGLILGSTFNAYYNSTGTIVDYEIGDANTKFPYYIDVNYIKIWKIKRPSDADGGCNALPNITISLLPGHIYDLAKSVTIGNYVGGTSHVVVHDTQKYIFHATKYIQLNKGFTVNRGGDFSAYIMPCYR